jgi:hypothetical protein
VREEDRLAADREVAALGPADVVLGHQDPPQVGVTAEDDPEEVVGLPLLEVRGREQLDAAGRGQDGFAIRGRGSVSVLPAPIPPDRRRAGSIVP